MPLKSHHEELFEKITKSLEIDGYEATSNLLMQVAVQLKIMSESIREIDNDGALSDQIKAIKSGKITTH